MYDYILINKLCVCVCVCVCVCGERELIDTDNNYCVLYTDHSPQTAIGISVDEKPLSGNNSFFLLLILFLCSIYYHSKGFTF